MASVIGNEDTNDRLRGTAEADAIQGLSGFDTLIGGAGKDTLDGGPDADTLNGGAGNDLFLGSPGADSHIGGRGRDTVSYAGLDEAIVLNGIQIGGHPFGIVAGHTFTGIEVFVATRFDDGITGVRTAATYKMGGGDDRITAGQDDDTVLGQGGNDTVSGGGGDDLVKGNGGDDAVRGSFGNDRVFGGGGNDRLVGDESNEAGNDTLKGGGGDDELIGGGGTDILTGGRGFDTFTFTGGGWERSTITDFDDDRIYLFDTGVDGYREVFRRARDVGDDVEIDTGIGLIVIEDMTRADLNADMFFIFNP